MAEAVGAGSRAVGDGWWNCGHPGPARSLLAVKRTTSRAGAFPIGAGRCTLWPTRSGSERVLAAGRIKMRIRSLFACVLMTLVLAAAGAARAQDAYPNRVIRFIVGFAAGGGNDHVRAPGGEQVPAEHRRHRRSIENKPGAGGRISSDLRRATSRRTATPCWSAPPARCRSPPRSIPISPTTDQELHPAQHDRLVPAGAGGAGQSSGQEREGTGGLGQGASRQVELRHLVAGLHHRHRTVEAEDRHAGGGDSVQGQQRIEPCAWSASSACSRSPTARRRSRW